MLNNSNNRSNYVCAYLNYAPCSSSLKSRAHRARQAETTHIAKPAQHPRLGGDVVKTVNRLNENKKVAALRHPPLSLSLPHSPKLRRRGSTVGDFLRWTIEKSLRACTRSRPVRAPDRQKCVHFHIFHGTLFLVCGLCVWSANQMRFWVVAVRRLRGNRSNDQYFQSFSISWDFVLLVFFV